MAVLLDAKDLAKIDREYAAGSVIWSVLAEGGSSITEADFVGSNEVRINKLSGFTSSAYSRNAENARGKISVTKETRKLLFERWMAYDLDALDVSENGGFNPVTIVEEHVQNVAIPEKDSNAARRILNYSDKLVSEEITTASALEAFDAAEQYMTDSGIAGPYVMFASSDYYRKLKNCEGVSRTFGTSVVNMSGIDRRVALLDNDIPIIRVQGDRLQQLENSHVNFVLMPLRAAAAVEKYNDVTLVPASSDRDGYRDTVKGLNYYDVIILDNARKAIYVSYHDDF